MKRRSSHRLLMRPKCIYGRSWWQGTRYHPPQKKTFPVLGLWPKISALRALKLTLHLKTQALFWLRHSNTLSVVCKTSWLSRIVRRFQCLLVKTKTWRHSSTVGVTGFGWLIDWLIDRSTADACGPKFKNPSTSLQRPSNHAVALFLRRKESEKTSCDYDNVT